MKEIILTKRFKTLVDDEDFEFLNQFKWRVSMDNYNNYALANIKINGIYKTIKLHRLIMNCPENMQIDHKDRNGLNNQKSNLRICTHSQNQSNRKSGGKSKYLGVSPCKNKYISTITVNNIKKYLGLFNTEKLAALAYDEAAKKYHGEFANLNF